MKPAAPSTPASAPTLDHVALGGAETRPATNPFGGAALYAAPGTAAEARVARTSSALARLASVPQAVWFGDETSLEQLKQRVAALVTTAGALRQLPVLVAYNIPQRDCGSYSGGGATTGAAYEAWINAFAAGIGSRPAVVILEPDAVAAAGCLSMRQQDARYALLTGAIERLNSDGHTSVYLDAGNARWIDAPTMARRLLAAGLSKARGFSLNVANFDSTASETNYGRRLSALIGDKPFVIDTSRNGRGASATSGWCNPRGRALGALPGSAPGDPRVDALLWIKHPGRSDGSCGRGEPAAGVFWPAYALGLATAAGW